MTRRLMNETVAWLLILAAASGAVGLLVYWAVFVRVS